MTKSVLVKRFNAGHSLSLLSGGRVVANYKLGDHSYANSFAEGWFGDEPIRWGTPQFRTRAA